MPLLFSALQKKINPEVVFETYPEVHLDLAHVQAALKNGYKNAKTICHKGFQI